MINPNQSPFDQYTLLHFGFGVMLREVGAPWPVALATSLAWELVIEPKYKDMYPNVFPAPSQDSIPNRVVDTLAVMGGWAVSDLSIKESGKRLWQLGS